MSIVELTSANSVEPAGIRDAEMQARVIARAREQFAERASAIKPPSPGDAAAKAEEQRRAVQTALAMDARAKTIRADANITMIKTACLSAMLTLGGYVAFGPVGFVGSALAGYALQKAARGIEL